MAALSLERVIVAHNPVEPGDDPSTADVLAQVEQVERGLAELGIAACRARVVAGRVWEALRPMSPQMPPQMPPMVFNLVESPPGSPHVHTAAAAALELLGVPFTGSAAAALGLTTDKIATRALLAAAGLPVAPGGWLDLEDPAVLDRVPGPWIVKPACEDASVGLEGNPVCATRDAALERAADLSRRFPGQRALAESYLPGREFNVALLEEEGGPRVLPIAEMTFIDFPPGEPRVLGYEAKWVEASFAYAHTRRRFPGDGDPLLARIGEIALAAWRICSLSGYARVDVRLDERGEPAVLEVNANPCLSEAAGFIAAAAVAGLGAGDVVERILRAALRRCGCRALPPKEPRTKPAPRPDLAIRALAAADREALEALLRATAFFNEEEVALALELIDDRLAHGEGSHYRFLVGELCGAVAGYACWGAIPGTQASADLYWIAVDPGFQGRGVGAALVAAAEERMAGEGRTRIYVETSTRAQYAPTRGFYRGCGYRPAAELEDYYAPGDGKAVFLKVLAG